ncbi:YidB family protein [Paractinoplanes toevensis]|uniref:Uncharacterized protein n=1 Tax=Paractinoplanes toevensis TaxID=571911 RepID=A0A920BQA7_9ACTN|nr:YidB family protein [Actinoplanes toevensis]GIM96511.1 hypothetical protein Ato02nite_083040 [Actinoplanes toevensis]
MDDITKLAILLDDPEVRELILGLGAAPRLHAIVLDLAGTVSPEQYRSWLSDDTRNLAMTPDQVRAALGDGPLGDLAAATGTDSGVVSRQLAGLLPDLVDAVSPGGRIVDPARLAGEITEARREDDLEAGVFGNQ